VSGAVIVRNPRRVVVVNDGTCIRPLIERDPSPTMHTVIEVLNAKKGQTTDAFYAQVNAFMDEQGRARKLVAIPIYSRP